MRRLFEDRVYWYVLNKYGMHVRTHATLIRLAATIFFTFNPHPLHSCFLFLFLFIFMEIKDADKSRGTPRDKIQYTEAKIKNYLKNNNIKSD